MGRKNRFEFIRVRMALFSTFTNASHNLVKTIEAPKKKKKRHSLEGFQLDCSIYEIAKHKIKSEIELRQI